MKKVNKPKKYLIALIMLIPNLVIILMAIFIVFFIRAIALANKIHIKLEKQELAKIYKRSK